MKELKFRNLTKDEIEVRVGGGGTLLLYKTARVDANLLDETVGAFNWQKRFYQVKNTMICAIAINMNYDHPELPPVWVEKCDGGDDDFTMEKVKGECSDSMKRCGFQWNIARNLYSAPKIKIPDQFKDCKFFDVEMIGYDKNDNISDLVISTNFGKDIVFSYKNGKKVSQNGENATKTPISEPNEPKGSVEKNDLLMIQAYVSAFDREQSRTNFYTWLDKNFGTMNLEMLTKSQGKRVLERLKNGK